MQSLTLSPPVAQAYPTTHPTAHPMIHARETASVAAVGWATPRLLTALGIVANALFWGGLLVPYHGSASSEIAFLHAFVAMLGGALALGGAAAVMLKVVRQVAVRLRSMELVAAVLHFSVIIAFAALSFSAFLRG